MDAMGDVRRSIRALGVALAVWPVGGCASLHSYQVDDIDSSRGTLTPFEVQVDETGLNLHEAMAVAKSVVDRESEKRLNAAEDVISLFQVGPSTGNPTFNDTWADGLAQAVRESCPSGQVTGVTTMRETNHYPVVSGEIVTVKGYCIR
jgi:hypothetical protein